MCGADFLVAGLGRGGAALSATCMAPHGANGVNTNPEWPNPAGQNAAYIEHQLHLFRRQAHG
jgi:cytochrome c553